MSLWKRAWPLFPLTRTLAPERWRDIQHPTSNTQLPMLRQTSGFAIEMWMLEYRCIYRSEGSKREKSQ